MARTEPTDEPLAWAAWLKLAMERAGMTGAALTATGVVQSQSTISKYLNGSSVPPDAELVIAIAHALHQPNAVEALVAAGMTRLASEIRQQIQNAYVDDALLTIRTNPVLSETQRAQIEQNYLNRRADAIKLMELEIARASQENRRRGGKPQDSGENSLPDAAEA